MPTLQQAQQLKEFAEEIFQLSKDVWAAQSRAKGKDETEISETEFLALDYLTRTEHTPTVGDIQKHLGVLPAQMSRIIRSLEKKGDHELIECRINAGDKRKVDVEITEEGRAAHQAYRKLKLGTTETMLLGLSEQDRSDFMRILRRIREIMHKPLK